MHAATIASTSAARETSAVNDAALPRSEVMMSTVSCAALPWRSTQNTCAPSRAKVTAVALPLPQPGPIEPAPTTIAVLPLSRSIDFSLYDLLNCKLELSVQSSHQKSRREPSKPKLIICFFRKLLRLAQDSLELSG